MATIKSYTDLEQSKKLVEFLPLETADMVYYKYANKPHKNDLDSPTIFKNNNEWYWIDIYDKTPCGKDDIMAWSLAALLGVLPNYQLQTQDDGIGVLCSCNGKFNIVTADNPVDACVAMVEKLNELNLL